MKTDQDEKIEACLEWFAIACLAIVILCSAFKFFGEAIESQEIYECHVWQQQAAEYPLFFMADWQKSQCDHYGIIVKAPVR